MKLFALLALLTALPVFGADDAGEEVAPPEMPPAIPGDVRVERDVAYLPADRRQMADLYFPAEIPAGKKLPALVIIHGGGFNDGDKAKYREVNIGTNAAQRGYIGMSINYRLWFKGATKPAWPQSLLDSKTAVRWLRRMPSACTSIPHTSASSVAPLGEISLRCSPSRARRMDSSPRWIPSNRVPCSARSISMARSISSITTT